MCNCIIKEKKYNPRYGYFDYIFLCKKNNGRNRVVTITSSNDLQAKFLAEMKCDKEEEDEEIK
jgi:hypothetical protein